MLSAVITWLAVGVSVAGALYCVAVAFVAFYVMRDPVVPPPNDEGDIEW